ncbi:MULTISPECIES: alpha/beta fold hydrolase [unclassified Haloferax]
MAPPAFWDPVVPHLGDYEVVVPERPGFGTCLDDAETTPAEAVLEREVECVRELVDGIRAATGRDPVLFGHSYGALTALEAATDARVAAVAAYEPAVLPEANRTVGEPLGAHGRARGGGTAARGGQTLRRAGAPPRRHRRPRRVARRMARLARLRRPRRGGRPDEPRGRAVPASGPPGRGRARRGLGRHRRSRLPPRERPKRPRRPPDQSVRRVRRARPRRPRRRPRAGRGRGRRVPS